MNAQNVRIPSDVGSVCWLRRDLRLHDNGALHEALGHARRHGGKVLCVFVFDTVLLDRLPDRDDRRVAFIAASVAELDASLRALGGGLLVLHGNARDEIPALASRLGRVAVFASGDQDPHGLLRDDHVRRELSSAGSSLAIVEDHVVVPTDAIRSGSGQPYRVFTPFSRAWSTALEADPDHLFAARPSHDARDLLAPPGTAAATAGALLERIGFRDPGPLAVLPGETAAQAALGDFLARLDGYANNRDTTSLEATSRLSPHLRFGTISARGLVRRVHGRDSDDTRKWISEIAWREFHQMLLRHFPDSVERAFQPKFESVVWDDLETDSVAKERFDAWKDGRTGYPFVDAAMRELRATGWMHNRCRMVVSSFLAKDLHIHWKRGERWFARWLLDIELASNVGGWQWSAGTGADAQPWFRIFNPSEQGKRWDPDGTWTRRWCPELASLPARWLHTPWTAPSAVLERAGVRLGREWPQPIVDHAVERIETLTRFGKAG